MPSVWCWDALPLLIQDIVEGLEAAIDPSKGLFEDHWTVGIDEIKSHFKPPL